MSLIWYQLLNQEQIYYTLCNPSQKSGNIFVGSIKNRHDELIWPTPHHCILILYLYLFGTEVLRRKNVTFCSIFYFAELCFFWEYSRGVSTLTIHTGRYKLCTQEVINYAHRTLLKRCKGSYWKTFSFYGLHVMGLLSSLFSAPSEFYKEECVAGPFTF